MDAERRRWEVWGKNLIADIPRGVKKRGVWRNMTGRNKKSAVNFNGVG